MRKEVFLQKLSYRNWTCSPAVIHEFANLLLVVVFYDSIWGSSNACNSKENFALKALINAFKRYDSKMLNYVKMKQMK